MPTATEPRLLTGATYIRFIAEHDPAASAVGVTHLDALFAHHSWVPKDVRSGAREALEERGADGVANYLRGRYAALETHGVTETEIKRWVTLMTQFDAATTRGGPAVAADFADLFR